jgi:hypothetical protein
MEIVPRLVRTAAALWVQAPRAASWQENLGMYCIAAPGRWIATRPQLGYVLILIIVVIVECTLIGLGYEPAVTFGLLSTGAALSAEIIRRLPKRRVEGLAEHAAD